MKIVLNELSAQNKEGLFILSENEEIGEALLLEMIEVCEKLQLLNRYGQSDFKLLIDEQQFKSILLAQNYSIQDWVIQNLNEKHETIGRLFAIIDSPALLIPDDKMIDEDIFLNTKMILSDEIEISDFSGIRVAYAMKNGILPLVSFNTENWQSPTIVVFADNKRCELMNIGTQAHIFEHHFEQIIREYIGIEHKNLKPSFDFKNDTNPEKKQFIVKDILPYEDLTNLYLEYFAFDKSAGNVTDKNKWATMVAKINGWVNEVKGKGRVILKHHNNKMYIGIDKQECEFEIYAISDHKHKGAISFDGKHKTKPIEKRIGELK
jgi:hypothetical protein